MLRTEGLECVVGGNIGAPMLDLLPQISSRTNVILELSSFQLGLLRRSPHIAVVTNISPNHLDRHGSLEDYLSAKRHIIRYQIESDVAVFNAGDAEVAAWRHHTPAQLRWFGQSGVRGTGATVRDGQAGLLRGERFEPVLPVTDVPCWVPTISKTCWLQWQPPTSSVWRPRRWRPRCGPFSRRRIDYRPLESTEVCAMWTIQSRPRPPERR
jgi:UDP-N-acetylmuramoylalanine-D-glutamate ligase